MRTVAIEIARVLPSVLCAVAATLLVFNNSPNWGWFLIAAVLLGGAALAR